MEVSIHTVFADVLERTARRDSLVGKIAEWIGSAIIEGRLRPDDDLNSVALSNHFQTSRTPVREALMILEKEGLVTIPPRRRPHVAHVGLREVREIYRVRAHLYMLVSELIVAQAPDEAFAELRAQQARLEEAASASDMDAYFWRNLSFRATEAAICGNDQLRRLLDSLGLRTLQARHQSLTVPGRMAQSARDHARLVQAYEERDAPLAIALTRTLVLGGLAAVEATGWAARQSEQDMHDMDGGQGDHDARTITSLDPETQTG
ncbi:MAG TPA: GntR family transcriptional regulator [Ktedonobacterales bacterium]|nr:GntR family transcriptional regulator [Ktedonobacterales bacterium]